MPNYLFRTAAAFCAGSLIVGCSNFLDSPGAKADPNLPTGATNDQLFVGAQANIFAQQEGPLAMIACQWMQQCSGVNGRFVEQQDSYSVNAGTFDVPFQEVYSAGGLVALRTVQASSDAAGDKVYEGVAQVLEALLVGTTASIWGDIPYSEAVGSNPTPPFDGQLAVYASLQTLLDKAITNLQGAGPGPGAVDLFYAGDKAKWIRAANTLKARFYMHTAEVAGAPAYTAARTAALLGINSPNNDLRSAHATATSERNMWPQFQNTSFGPDLVAGNRLVEMMKAQNDPRLPEYFGVAINGNYGGFDVTTGTTPGDAISPLDGSRNSDTFRQPILTWEENQLILAETNFKLSGIAAAQPYLDAVRTGRGKSIVPATLQNIMEEKYIAMFQNIEAWNDWKRTCFPVLKPALGKTVIPGRLYYGQTEEQTNPNTPPSSAQNLFTVRNPNDPNPC
ncbi:MAG TPA: SusD/RagB family nutrient-binding outer membrane lipoprotein [Gemmatimonadaceae bacterium]